MDTNPLTRSETHDPSSIESVTGEILLAAAHPPPPMEVSLRPMDLSDIDDFMEWATDSKVARFCTWEPYTSREAGIAHIRDQILPHPWLRAICLAGKPIGSISVTPVDKIRWKLGYVIGSGYWGRGIATAAVRLVAAEVFRDMPAMARLEALVDLENMGSQRVLEKVGFTREGVLRKFMLHKGSVRDMVMFSLLPDDPLLSDRID
ncbi:PREDICTED: uncharacterized protein LOC104815883 [Tarenaya hassleriana]|uniref:uncharacterized protein LOC104815883 n=1 Tax=Tarenaya hassleriana TaxID=28532 RepID=UPI00053C1FA2|nr:PREDICTED: uncharacterized protein LOC104815883 [Tarenaya hassleriana]